MIDLLQKNLNGTYDIVSDDEITIGNHFYNGKVSTDKRPISVTISEIHEQRKERGQYKNESDRRMWAKVSAS